MEEPERSGKPEHRWPWLRRWVFWGLLCNTVGMVLMALYAGDPFVAPTPEPMLFGLKSLWWFRAGLFLNVVGFAIRIVDVMRTTDAQPSGEGSTMVTDSRPEPSETPP